MGLYRKTVVALVCCNSAKLETDVIVVVKSRVLSIYFMVFYFANEIQIRYAINLESCKILWLTNPRLGNYGSLDSILML